MMFRLLREIIRRLRESSTFQVLSIIDKRYIKKNIKNKKEKEEEEIKRRGGHDKESTVL